MLVRTEQIDPKDYPFKKYIDEQKHLDTDELRSTIKPVNHKIDECFKGQEHLYCDKSQLCPLGKFRRPKILVESERRGFKNVKEMADADAKAEEEKKKKEEEEKAKLIVDQKAELDDLKKQLSTLASSFQSYIQAVHPQPNK
jgi:hypothetical protein